MERVRLTTRDRRALAATAGQFFVNGAMTAAFIARAPQFRDRIGVTVDEFGLLIPIASVVGLLGSLVAGRVVHVASTKRVLQVDGGSGDAIVQAIEEAGYDVMS